VSANSAGIDLPSSLEPGQVYVLWADIHRPVIPVEELVAVLSPEEKERAGRLRFEIDRTRNQMGWGLLRILLGRLLVREPRSIRFSFNKYKKPLLDEGPSFNMAHSGNWVLIGLARDGRLGVDVEEPRDLKDLLGLAETVFTPDELEQLREYPETQRKPAFFRGWTRKEAFVKAVGGGLYLPLKKFAVSLDSDAEEALRWVELPSEQGVSWCVRPLDHVPDAPGAFAWDRPCTEVQRLRPNGLKE